MLHITVDIDVPTEEDAQMTLEHIGREIGNGYKAGEGWDVEGESEESEET